MGPTATMAACLLSLWFSTPCGHGLLLPQGHGRRLGRMGKWVLPTDRKPLLAGADQVGVIPRHTQWGVGGCVAWWGQRRACSGQGCPARGPRRAGGQARAPAPRERPQGPGGPPRPQRGAGARPHLAVRSRWRWCRKEEGRLGAGPRARRRSFVSLQR